MKYLVQALLEITAWLLLPLVALQVAYAIEKNNMAGYLKDKNIKVKNSEWN